MNKIKAIALLTPLILSIIILIVVFKDGLTSEVKFVNYKVATGSAITTFPLDEQYEMYKEDLQSIYETELGLINQKIDISLSLIGIAITVWVGLNIYNLVEKKQVDELNKKIVEEEIKGEYIIAQQNWFNDQIQFRTIQLNSEKNISALYHSIESFIYSFTKLINTNKKLKDPYILEYTIFLNILINALLDIYKYKDSLIGKDDLLRKTKIKSIEIERKISNSIDSIYQIIINDKVELIKCLQNKKYGVQNFLNLKSGLEQLNRKIKKNNPEFDLYEIDTICNEIKK